MNNNYSITLKIPLISVLLGVAFVVLKLCEVIAWKWIWVVSPFWISIGFWTVGLIIFAFIKAIQAFIKEIKDNKHYSNTLGNYGIKTRWISELGVIVDNTGHEVGYKQEEEES